MMCQTECSLTPIDDRYEVNRDGGRGSTCRGEREGVLGSERNRWDPVAWALNTSTGGMVEDPSRHKQCRDDEGCQILPSFGS